MGISDELRDLAATPPEATALSASLADQAVGFAVHARRVAHLKVTAAISAVTIAAAGVGIGIITSNNDSELPTTTPVVTITPTPSGSQSPSQSPSSQSPSQETSSAPVLEQSPAIQQQITGPGPEKNIVERIIDTLASLPQWVIDKILNRNQPAEPEQTAETEQPPATQPSPAESSTSSGPSSTSPTPSPQQPKSSSSAAPPPTDSTKKSSSPSGDTTSKCWTEEKRKGRDGEFYPTKKDPEPVACDDEQYAKYWDQSSSRFTPDSSASRVCKLVKQEDGRSPDTTSVPIPCEEMER